MPNSPACLDQALPKYFVSIYYTLGLMATQLWTHHGSCWNKNICCQLPLLLLSRFSHVRICETPEMAPRRFPWSWDSPGKNTGMGCHFLLQCMKVKSESEVAQACPTLSDPMDYRLPGASVHGIFQARALEWAPIAFSSQLPLPIPKGDKKAKLKTVSLFLLNMPSLFLETISWPVQQHEQWMVAFIYQHDVCTLQIQN